jgi:hypothetical protein
MCPRISPSGTATFARWLSRSRATSPRDPCLPASNIDSEFAIPYYRVLHPLKGGCIVTKHRIFTTSVASVYPHYVTKAERKGRTKPEVDAIIRWLTGYSQVELEAQLDKRTDFETFFAEAPQMNPSRALIKGVVCGVRVEDIEEPVMREIRYLDKLIDELAKGKVMEKILRR